MAKKYFVCECKHNLKGKVDIPVTANNKDDATRLVLKYLQELPHSKMFMNKVYKVRELREAAFETAMDVFHAIQSNYGLEGDVT